MTALLEAVRSHVRAGRSNPAFDDGHKSLSWGDSVRAIENTIGELERSGLGRSPVGLDIDHSIGAAILLVALLIVWIWRLTRKTRGTAASLNVPALPTTDVEAWLQNSPGEELAAVPSEAAGSGTVPTNGQAKHAFGPPAHDSTDHIE